MADKPINAVGGKVDKGTMGLLYPLPVLLVLIAWMPFEKLVFNENYLASFAAGYAVTLAVIAIAYEVLRRKFVGMDTLSFLIVPAFGAAGAAGNAFVATENSGNFAATYVVVANAGFFTVATIVAINWAVITRLR
ncbi:MAG: hypothetical protein F4X83_00130 [Chloroflexi bacterium]|nr:hypothetical protein [Chloroflexota bacterium]